MNINNHVVNEALVLHGAAVDRVAEMAGDFAKTLNMERSNILRTRLSVEEILLRWMDNFGEGIPFHFVIGYRMGLPYLSLELTGDVCNPLITEEDQDEWSAALMDKLGLAPKFTYEKGKNRVVFQLKKRRWNPAVKLLVIIVLATLVGMAGKYLLPPHWLTLLSANLLTPLYDAFFRLLNLAAGPVVFLSVLAAVYEVGSIAVLGSLGSKMGARFIGLCFVLTSLAAVLCLPFFDLTVGTGRDYIESSNLLAFLLSFVPNDILTPFIKGDSQSLIFVAVLLGNILLAQDRQWKESVSVSALAGGVMRRIVDGVNQLGGAVIFVVIVLQIWTNTIKGVMGLWRLILLYVLLAAVYLAGIILYICVREKVNVLVLLRKLGPSFWIALKTGSVTEAHSENVSCCERKLGISPMVIHYGIPLGSTVYMPGVAISIMLISLYVAEQWAIEISLVWLLLAFILTTVLAIAAPPFAGAGLLTFAAVFTQLGLPSQALALALVADSFMSFIESALDQTLLQMDLIIQADRLRLLDRERLRRK